MLKLAELNMSATKAAEIIGISRDTIHKWFKREILDYKQKLKITAGLGLDENDIWPSNIEGLLNLAGKFAGSDNKEMLKAYEMTSFARDVLAVPTENYMMVEYVDLSASAGALGGSDLDMLPETKKRLVPKEFDKGNYLVVRVNGDSMVDGTDVSIPDGAEILVKEHIMEPGERLPIRGNLFVICSREGNVFKQVVEHNEEMGYIRCHSYNKRYSDYDIPLKDVFQIFIYKKIVGYRPSIPEINV